jgi:hypothetical protein
LQLALVHDLPVGGQDAVEPVRLAGPARRRHYRPRHALVDDVTQAASQVSRPIHEACDLNLPVDPALRDGRNALVHWAVLLEEVLP